MDKVTTVYLIRHGESVGNKENRVRGHMDFPLNENGAAQAEALAEALRGKKIKHIYSSPLARAVKTAEIICGRLGIEYETKEEFNNINLGCWENRRKEDLAREFPDMWDTWMNRPDELVIDGGETLAQVRERSLRGLAGAIEKHEGEAIAIVGHRGNLKPIISGAVGIMEPSYWKIHVDTASYSVLIYDNLRGYSLIGLNYKEHLKDIPLIQEFD